MTALPKTLNSPGQTYKSFQVTRVVAIPEVDCFLRELVHIPTQAKVLHIENDDPENVFCLSFQTLPDNSNGVAHILEHTVLCGSEKFPIKDPFFAMTRRSLNTFMNAFTGADFTCYPAASQVTKDFYNLLDVYLDAVFHPNIKELSFLQEGHRLEFADPENPESPLEIKGIVFNEMKGALSSPQSRLAEEVNAALFPDITYGYNSGGDPKDISSLTYEQLKHFHETYYHPSRCLFYFYGNLPLEQHLDFISEQTLNKTIPAPPLAPIPDQPRFTDPVRVEKSYPVAADEDVEDKTFISFAWLTCPIKDQKTLLALTVLEIILMDTDASPLKMALLKSGLCKQVSAHMESDAHEVPFVLTLTGCKADAADQAERLIRKTLESIIKEGISEHLIDNALHQLEFHRSEIQGNHAPYGLHLFMRAGLLRQHQVNPEEGLTIHTLFKEIHDQIEKNPKYLTDLIKCYLLDNSHFVRILMKPSKELAAQELAKEKEGLEKLRQQLSEQERALIISRAKELEEFQKKQEEEDLDVLPKVTLNDVSHKSRDYALHVEKVGHLLVYHHPCFTNDIVYADLVFHLPMIPEEDLPLVRLMAILVPQMGCGGRTYAENLDYMQAHTGGMSASITFNLQADDHNHFSPSFNLRGKALHRKAEKMFKMLHEMASNLDFSDKNRLKEVIIKHYSNLQTSLPQSALKYAMNLSASGLDVSSRMANEWYGLSYYNAIRAIAENIDQEIDKLSTKLAHYAKLLLCLEDPHLVISCNQALYDELKRTGFYGLDKIETKSFHTFKDDYAVAEVESHARTIASPVAFTSRVFKTVSYSHPDSPALLVAGNLFDNLTLHAAIREQGGAYGGGASSNSLAGNFSFYSYRDPNIVSSLDAFDMAVKEVAEGNFDDEDLEEALLEIIQGFDSPIAPGSRADVAYGWLREGKPLAVRQAYRDRLLSLKKEDIIAATKKHLVDHSNDSVVVTFADKALLNTENAKLLAAGKKPLATKSVYEA